MRAIESGQTGGRESGAWPVGSPASSGSSWRGAAPGPGASRLMDRPPGLPGAASLDPRRPGSRQGPAQVPGTPGTRCKGGSAMPSGAQGARGDPLPVQRRLRPRRGGPRASPRIGSTGSPSGPSSAGPAAAGGAGGPGGAGRRPPARASPAGPRRDRGRRRTTWSARRVITPGSRPQGRKGGRPRGRCGRSGPARAR